MFKHLFSGQLLSQAFDGERARFREEVEAISEDQFLSSSIETIVAFLSDRFRFDPLVVYWDQRDETLAHGKAQSKDQVRYDLKPGETVEIRTLEIRAVAPYSGHPALWDRMPSVSRPSGLVGGITLPQPSTNTGTLTLIAVMDAATDDPQRLRTEIDRQIAGVTEMLEIQRRDIETFNASLRDHLEPLVLERRRSYEKFLAAAQTLKLRIHSRAEAPPLQPLLIERRRPPELPPATTSTASVPEAGITERTYEDILRAIRNQGRQFECTPTTYVQHDEEDLRNILWGNLATHFERDVSGEAFSRAGKTDIRIDENGRAAFIAECKVWAGTKELCAAITQLLGYTRWRDCKTALIVFNKDRDNFTALLKKAPEALKEHLGYKGIAGVGAEPGEFRMVFAPPDDDQRRITVHVFLFDLFLR